MGGGKVSFHISVRSVEGMCGFFDLFGDKGLKGSKRSICRYLGSK